MWPLLKTFSWQEIAHHPWRTAVAVLAVMLGVALAFAVHLINASALAEFGAAVRAVNGQPDLELRPREGQTLPESLYARVAALLAGDDVGTLAGLGGDLCRIGSGGGGAGAGGAELRAGAGTGDDESARGADVRFWRGGGREGEAVQADDLDAGAESAEP